jgi:hypothetical protein
MSVLAAGPTGTVKFNVPVAVLNPKETKCMG